MWTFSVYRVVGICFLIQISFSRRRINDGQYTSGKSYVVYLLKAAPSDKTYTGWLCGGSIVSAYFVITSAACVQDVHYMYVIAGHKKYVDVDKLDTDDCISQHRKKVVLVCVPEYYDLQYQRIDKWARGDIALVKVDKWFDTRDQSYINDCTYMPGRLTINYDSKYQEPGIDAVAFGWGHDTNWRQIDDLNTYNSNEIKYTSLVVIKKSECKKHYTLKEENQQTHNKLLLEAIDKYMICTEGPGELNENGDYIQIGNRTLLVGCVTQNEMRLGARGPICDEESSSEIPDDVYYDDTESPIEVPEEQEPILEIKENKTKQNKDKPTVYRRSNNKKPLTAKRRSYSRRTGICQNDHGGPLVTWRGGKEILIGVATAFRVVNNSCTGPYLFTSTQCHGKFIDCVMNADFSSLGIDWRRRCENESQVGFKISRRHISWINHPDGPAENEVIEMRQQVPLHSYHFSRRDTQNDTKP